MESPKADKTVSDYRVAAKLAKHLGGRSVNLDDSSDRQAMKVTMLRFNKTEALKILEK